MLMDYAKSNGVAVTFKCEDGNLLSKAVKSSSEPHVEFILDKLTRKYATVSETIELLESHLLNLTDNFPKLALRFLKEGDFAVEYARLEVPRALFGRDGHTPVVMYVHEEQNPVSWIPMDSGAAKELWKQGSDYTEQLSDTTSQQIKVVAKFSCISHGSFFAVYGRKYVYNEY